MEDRDEAQLAQLAQSASSLGIPAAWPGSLPVEQEYESECKQALNNAVMFRAVMCCAVLRYASLCFVVLMYCACLWPRGIGLVLLLCVPICCDTDQVNQSINQSINQLLQLSVTSNPTPVSGLL